MEATRPHSASRTPWRRGLVRWDRQGAPLRSLLLLSRRRSRQPWTRLAAVGLSVAAIVGCGAAARPAAAASSQGATQGATAGRLILLLTTATRHGVLTQLAWVPPGGGSLHTIGKPGSYQGLAAQANGGLLALGSSNGLVLVHSDGHALAHLRPAGAPPIVAMPAWSRDGQRLAFLAAPRPHRATAVERALWIAGRDGRGARRILDPRQTADLLTVAWAPNGRQLVLSRFARGQGAISILDLQTYHERFLIKGFDATWSSDGKRIAYDVRGRPGDARLWMFDVPTHHARQLTTQGLRQAAVPVWLGDGRTLAFFGTDATAPTFVQSYGLYTVASGGGRPHLVTARAASLLPVGQSTLVWAVR